jgi:hypothetical protein
MWDFLSVVASKWAWIWSERTVGMFHVEQDAWILLERHGTRPDVRVAGLLEIPPGDLTLGSSPRGHRTFHGSLDVRRK